VRTSAQITDVEDRGGYWECFGLVELLPSFTVENGEPLSAGDISLHWTESGERPKVGDFRNVEIEFRPAPICRVITDPPKALESR
jgi:hypothetical protein